MREDGRRGEPPQLLGKELSPKQVEVLSLAAQGYTYRQIGLARNGSAQSARDRMSLARQKLGAINKTHAVAIAKDRGLI